MNVSNFSFVRSLIVACILVSLSLSTTLHAQNASVQLFNDGLAAVNENNFAKTAQIMEEFIQKFPQDKNASNARYLLGVAQYYLGDYAKSAENLSQVKDLPEEYEPSAKYHLGASYISLGDSDKAIAPLEAVIKGTNQDLIPLSSFLLARAYMDIGSKQMAKDKATGLQSLNKAIATTNDLIKKYPDNEIVLDAYMTKASANALAGNYEASAEDIEELKSQPGGSIIALDADYLLGYVLAQQAQNLINVEYKPEEAAVVIQKARTVYQRLAKSDNLIIANDASFELANLSFSEKKYKEAMNDFRNLRSKDELIESQNQRLADIRNQISKAAGNKAQVASLQRLLQREETKLKNLKANPDNAVDALIRIGDCYLRLGKYDEARTIYRHASQFAEEDKAKEAHRQIIISQALQGFGGKADEEFKNFKTKYPNDPSAEGIPFFIARALIQQGRYDEAIQKFEDLIKNSPNSSFAALAVQEIARALIGQGKTDEALSKIKDFISKAKAGTYKVPPDSLEEAQKFEAYTLYSAKKVDEATSAMKALYASAKNPAIKEEAAYQYGNFLTASQKFAEANEALIAFLKEFPDSSYADKARYAIAQNYTKLSELDKAVEAYRDLIAKSESMKIYGYEAIWKIYQSQNDFDKMVQTQDEMIEAFPESPRSIFALGKRAEMLEKMKKTDEAYAIYDKLYTRYTAMDASAKTTDFGKILGSYAARGLLRKAQVAQVTALRMGNPLAMNAEQKEKWKGLLNDSSTTLDNALKEYADTQMLPYFLKLKIEVMVVMIQNGLMDRNDGFTFLSQLAGTIGDESLKAQVLIGRASLAYQLGLAGQSAQYYKDAFDQIKDPTKIGWQDYDQYGTIQLEQKKWDEALQLFQKMMENNPDNKQAQAAGLFGMGVAYQGKGDQGKAEEYFTRLSKEYPTSPKILEAEYARSVAATAGGKYQEAIDILKKVVNNPRATNEVRAKSLIQFAICLEFMGDKKIKTPETKTADGKEVDIYELASGYYKKVVLLYPSYTDQCAESLFRLVALLSKTGKKAEATKFATELSTKYPATEWARKVGDVLK